jgi:hypothetical protein
MSIMGRPRLGEEEKRKTQVNIRRAGLLAGR